MLFCSYCGFAFVWFRCGVVNVCVVVVCCFVVFAVLFMSEVLCWSVFVCFALMLCRSCVVLFVSVCVGCLLFIWLVCCCVFGVFVFCVGQLRDVLSACYACFVEFVVFLLFVF